MHWMQIFLGLLNFELLFPIIVLVLFSFEDFPHLEVFKLIQNVPHWRPFIIVTGYSQNEPWKIFAFNLVPPNLVCLLKTFMQCSLTPPPVLLYLQLIKTRLCLLAITPDWWEVLKSKHRFVLSLSHLLINIFIYKFHHVRIVIWSQAYLLYFGRQDSSQIVLLLFCLLCREDVIIWMFGTSINGDCLVLFRPVKF